MLFRVVDFAFSFFTASTADVLSLTINSFMFARGPDMRSSVSRAATIATSSRAQISQQDTSVDHLWNRIDVRPGRSTPDFSPSGSYSTMIAPAPRVEASEITIALGRDGDGNDLLVELSMT